MTITGTDLSTATAVSFNGTAATSFLANTNTQITAVVGGGTSTGPITVTTLGGSATSATSFTAVTITSFSPTSGGTGTPVTITGVNLTGATAVAFNGTAASAFTVNSSTQITATVAAGTTSGPISVTTPLGIATSTTNFVASPGTYATSPPSWIQHGNTNTLHQFGAAVTGPDGRVYLFGSDSSPYNSAEVFNPNTNAWTVLPNMPTGRGELAAALGADGRIYVMGGQRGAGALSVVEVYDPRLNTWSTAASMPTALADLAAAAGSDGRIYAIGGSYSNQVYAYNLSTNTWTAVASMSHSRYGPAATVGPDGRIDVMGGYDNYQNNSVEAYNIASNTWSPVTSLGSPHQGSGAATGPDGRVYIVGGQDGPDVEVYDLVTQSWAVLSPLPNNNSQAVTAAVTGDGRIVAVNYYSNFDGTYLYGPSVTLTPSTGFAASSFTLSGSNFATNAGVRVFWGNLVTGTPLGTATTDGSGNLATQTYAVPGTLSGTVQLTVIDDRSFYPALPSYTAGKITATSGGSQSGTVGTQLLSPLVVTAVDVNNNSISGLVITFVSALGGTFGGTLSTTQVTTNASGQASALYTLGPTAGANTVLVYANGFANPVTFAPTGNPGTASTLAFTLQQPTATQVGSVIAPSVEASVVDQFGNVVTQTGWTISVALSGPSSGDGAVLGGTTTVGPTAGATATFSSLTVSERGQYTLTASTPGLTSGASSTFLVVPASATPTWVHEPNTPNNHYYGVTVTGADGRVYSIGGNNAPNAADVYDPVANSWSSLPNIPTGRMYRPAGALGPDGRIYVMGGENTSSQAISTVEAYDPTTNSWSAVASMPTINDLLAGATGSDGRIDVMEASTLSTTHTPTTRRPTRGPRLRRCPLEPITTRPPPVPTGRRFI